MEGGMDYNECESGWLIVENDLSTRLTKPEQLRYALQCMGRNPSDKAVERYWSQCGGAMSYDQFCFVMQREKRTTMSDLMKSFRKIDINGDGYITAKELHRMLTKRGEKMTHDEVQAIIDEADKNGDGKLDYAEFCHMLLTTSEQCVQASKQKANTLGQQPAPVKSRQRGEQVKFQQQRGSKSRSSSHRGAGLERRERRREEIRSHLYPAAEDHRGGEPHLLHRRHHRTGVEGSRPLYASDSNGHHFPGYQNGFPQEPKFPHSAPAPAPHSFPQSTVSGAPFSDLPVSYTDQLQPMIPNQGQKQPLIQPTKPALSSTVETTEAKVDAEVKEAPPTLQEKKGEEKPVDNSSVPKEELSKPLPLTNAEKPLQEKRKDDVIQLEDKDKDGPTEPAKPHPLTTEPTKPHPPAQSSIEPTPSIPSKSDLNNETESLASVIPSSKQISDPLALPSSSLSKLPPLKKSLPPLLPPIGATTITAANQGVENIEQHETKELEMSASPALSSEREVMKAEKEVSNKEDSSSTSVVATHRDDREGGRGENEVLEVVDKGSPRRGEDDGACAEQEKQQTVDSTDQNGDKSNDGTSDSQGQEIKDGPSATATKHDGNGSNEHTDQQQKQEETEKNHQSVASSMEEEKEGVVKDNKDEWQTDHLNRGRGKEEEQHKSKGKGEEGKAEGGKEREERTEGGKGGQQKSGGKGGQGKAAVSAPTSVVTPPPKQPRNLKAWNNITGKGCFYLEVEVGEGSGPQEEGVVTRCHQYRLSLPSPTNVWIEIGVAKPGIQATDVLLFVFHTDKDDEPTELVTYTQHKVGERWISRLDLDAGTYALIPFTSGCHLKPREDPIPVDATPLIEEGEGGKVSLTEGCQKTLKEVFHRIDLDGNGCISRMEFDFFQEMTSGESCDDDAWKVIQDNFELTGDDEITLKGFLDLHVMTAEDEEGGEGEVWDILNTMGYNKQLQLDQACPFTLEVFTEDCEGEIEIVDLLPFNPIVDPALCRLVVERGVCGEVRDGNGELFMYTFTTPHLTTIAVENKGTKRASMQLDCSRSANFVPSRDSSVCVLPLQPKSITIGIHLLPESTDEPYTVDCIASKILC